MQTKKLSEGDVVWVVLPYEGGRGWATVDELDIEPDPGHRARTIRVSFLTGSGPVALRTRAVRPHDIVRKRGEEDEEEGASAETVEILDRLLDFALLPDHVQELGRRLQAERDRYRAALERVAAGDFAAANIISEMRRIAREALGDTTSTESRVDESDLDRAATGREIGRLVAMVLIRCHGNAEEALEMLASFEGVAPPEGPGELDAVTIAAQAIREARGRGVLPR